MGFSIFFVLGHWIWVNFQQLATVVPGISTKQVCDWVEIDIFQPFLNYIKFVKKSPIILAIIHNQQEIWMRNPTCNTNISPNKTVATEEGVKPRRSWTWTADGREWGWEMLAAMSLKS